MGEHPLVISAVKIDIYYKGKSYKAVYSAEHSSALSVYTELSAFHAWLSLGLHSSCHCLAYGIEALFAAVRTIINTHIIPFLPRRRPQYLQVQEPLQALPQAPRLPALV